MSSPRDGKLLNEFKRVQKRLLYTYCIKQSLWAHIVHVQFTWRRLARSPFSDKHSDMTFDIAPGRLLRKLRIFGCINHLRAAYIYMLLSAEALFVSDLFETSIEPVTQGNCSNLQDLVRSYCC